MDRRLTIEINFDRDLPDLAAGRFVEEVRKELLTGALITNVERSPFDA